MADETQPSGRSANGAPAEAEQEIAPLVIGAQYIKDLSFENPLGPEAMAELTEAPAVEVEVNTNIRHLAEQTYEVTLFLRGDAKAAGKSVFIIELTYGGVVSINNIPEESIHPVLSIDAPRHLFPFARAIIANITRDGGFPPMMINPIDFAGLYLQQFGDEPTED